MSGRQMELTEAPKGMALTPVPAALPAEQTEPRSLVQLAIERNVPVEILKQLVALQQQVAERDARAAFVEALTAFRAECPPIPKTHENTQFSVTRNGVKRTARYASLEDIDRIARPVAASHGLAWTWDTRIEGEMMHVSCRVMHVLGHCEASTVTMPHESKAGSSPQQKFASTQTYGMRYSLVAALGLTTVDEDVDGAASEGAADTLTSDEIANVSALMDEFPEDDRARFLEYMNVAKVAEIRRSNLKRAIDLLEKKRAGAR